MSPVHTSLDQRWETTVLSFNHEILFHKDIVTVCFMCVRERHNVKIVDNCVLLIYIIPPLKESLCLVYLLQLLVQSYSSDMAGRLGDC